MVNPRPGTRHCTGSMKEIGRSAKENGNWFHNLARIGSCMKLREIHARNVTWLTITRRRSGDLPPGGKCGLTVWALFPGRSRANLRGYPIIILKQSEVEYLTCQLSPRIQSSTVCKFESHNFVSLRAWFLCCGNDLPVPHYLPT